MKRKVGSRYFVYNLSKILRDVKRGREVIVTVRGVPAFRLSPCLEVGRARKKT